MTQETPLMHPMRQLFQYVQTRANLFWLPAGPAS
jgi:hypothetical protein